MRIEILSHYVVRDKKTLNGEPIIRGTETPVRLVAEYWESGSKAEEIPNHLPHLTLAQVFDVLSYYCDNNAEIDDYIERNRIPEELSHPLQEICE